MCISIGHLSALCQEIVSPLSNWESDTLGNTQIRRPLWERMAFSRTNCPYPSDIPANGSANGSSPREKFLGTSENTRMKLRWVEEVGPQPESRAIANAKWLRDNFCLSSLMGQPVLSMLLKAVNTEISPKKVHALAKCAKYALTFRRGAFFAWRAPILSWPRIMCSQVHMLKFLEPSREML